MNLRDAEGLMRRQTWPLPPLWVATGAVLVAGATAAAMSQVLGWSFIDTAALSALPLDALVFVAPLVAAVAAFVSSTTWDPRTPQGSPVAVRSGWPAANAQLRVLLPLWTLAYVVAFVPFLMYGAITATGGHLQYVLIGYAGAAFGYFLVFGYTIGAVAPLRLTPLVVALLTSLQVFAAAYVPYTRNNQLNPWRVLLPVITNATGLGDRAVMSTWLWRVLLFLLASAALVALAVDWRNAVSRKVKAMRAAWSLLVPFGLAVSLVAAAPAVVVDDTDVRGLCSKVAEVQVCVATSQRPIAGQVNTAVAQTLALVGGKPDQLRSVHEQRLDRHVGEGPPRMPRAQHIDVNPADDVPAEVASSLADFLSGVYACSDNRNMRLQNRSYGLREALAHSAGGPRPPVPGSPGPPNGIRTLASWYRSYQTQILACQAPPLPQGWRNRALAARGP